MASVNVRGEITTDAAGASTVTAADVRNVLHTDSMQVRSDGAILRTLLPPPALLQQEIVETASVTVLLVLFVAEACPFGLR